MPQFEVGLKQKPIKTEQKPAESSKVEDMTTTCASKKDKNPKELQKKNKESSITKWSTDKIVAVGLVIMGLISISGYIAYALYTGNSNGSEIPMAIVSGLTGFLGRGALPHEEYPNKYGYPPQTIKNGESDYGRNGEGQCT